MRLPQGITLPPLSETTFTRVRTVPMTIDALPSFSARSPITEKKLYAVLLQQLQQHFVILTYFVILLFCYFDL
jgi:hypothetical protein